MINIVNIFNWTPLLLVNGILNYIYTKSLYNYNGERKLCQRPKFFGSSRKAWFLITIFANSFSYFSSLFFIGGKRKGENKIKVLVKSHAFLLDQFFGDLNLDLKAAIWFRFFIAVISYIMHIQIRPLKYRITWMSIIHKNVL